jgi:hypothetical protein
MKVYKLVFFVLLIISSCKTKEVVIKTVNKEVNYIPYYLKVYESDSLFITKNYQKSYEILDSLFLNYRPINLPNYNEVYNYYKLKIIIKKKIDRNNFSDLISKYNLNNETLEKDSLFNIYYKKEKKFIDKNYEVLKQIHASSININLRNEIKYMRLQDQLYRDKDYQINIVKQDKIDSINSKKAKKIFEDYGYPNQSIIGDFMLDKTFVDIEIILLHTKNNERMNYFMPKVLEFIKKGTALPKTYAVMQDQFNLYNNKNQFYGSYENKIKSSITELNKRRKEIGLPSYGYEEWRFKKLYPDEEY